MVLTQTARIFIVGKKFNIDSRNFNFWGICDKKNLLFGLDPMTAYLSNTGFEKRALFETREALKPIYLDCAKSPVAVIEDQYRKFMIDNDHMAHRPEEQSVFSVQMDDITKIAASHLPKRGVQIEYRGRLRSRNDYQKIQNTFGILSL
jgi:hypothetical protein